MKDDGTKVVKVIGFGRRLGAVIIDGIFLSLFTMLLVSGITILGTFLGIYGLNQAQFSWDRLIMLCGFGLSIIYYTWFWRRSGQTIGKTVLGIKVIAKDGAKLTWGKALLRYIGYLISAIPLSIGFLWVAFDRKRQGWHDKLAGTYVTYQEVDFSQSDHLEIVPADPRRSWVWVLLYLLIAISIPSALTLGLWFLGPFINGIAAEIIQNIFK